MIESSLQWGKLRTLPSALAYTFDVVAWQTFDGRRYGGPPPSADAARGLKVLATNPDDPGDTHQFWTYTAVHFQDFAEWWVYIGAMMTMHGLDLADEPAPDDDQYNGPDEDYDDEDEDDEEEEPPAKPSVIRRIIRRIVKWFR